MKKNFIAMVALTLALCFQVPAQTCLPAPVGLVTWLRGENNTLDSRGRSNASLTGGGLTYASGKVGQAWSFDGVSSQAFLLGQNPDSPNIGASATGFTLETWLYPTSSGSQQPIIHWFGGASFLGLNLWINRDAASGTNAGYLYANIIDLADNDHILASSSSVLTFNQFNHVALTYDKVTGIGTLYVNGVSVQSANLGIFTPRTFNASILIAQVFGIRYAGLIDDLSLYNRPLQAAEIQAIHNSGTAGKCAPTATIAPLNLAGSYAADGNTLDSVSAFSGLPSGNVGYKVGKVGQGFNFDPADGADSINYLTNGVFKGQTQATIEAWVRPLGPHEPGFGGAVFYEATSLAAFTRFGLFLDNSGQVIALGRTGENNAGTQLNSTSTIPNGQWSHVAATWDSMGGIRIYINGSLAGTLISAVGSFSNTNSAKSAISDPVNFFNGDIDEVATYTRSLTAEEITSIFNAGIAGKLKENTTPSGPNVAVQTKGDATVTFPSVTTAGITQQIPLDLATLPPLPMGPTTTGLTYDIATSATFSGAPQVCFNLPAVTNATTFGNLRILHLESGAWQSRTDLASINFATKTICSSGLPSLSPFAIVNGLSPTAASASIGGRVVSSSGRGLRGVTVTVSGGELAAPVSARTNGFGRFVLEDLPVGETYVIEVSSKRYTFVQSVRVISLTDDMNDADFMAVDP